MSKGRGCLKNGCLGCLGVLVLLIAILGVNAIIVVSNNGNELIEDRVVGTEAGVQNTPETTADLAPAETDKPEAGKGWLILELAQGEFQLHQGEPGEGVVVKANYDSSTYELLEYSHTWPDSAWVYHVDFHRTISGLQAVLREVMGGNHAPVLHVYIPPDLPLELNVLVKEGGLEADLGGLWLTDVDLRYNKGGFSLGFDEPLREPLNSLAIKGRMGGAEVRGVGNASPAKLDIDCTMGGMELDLGGAWSRDCDARVKLLMGGMEVSVPDNIDLEGAGLESGGMKRTDGEIVRPVLRLQQEVKAGEIEIH
jgi:hypothetical protein